MGGSMKLNTWYQVEWKPIFFKYFFVEINGSYLGIEFNEYHESTNVDLYNPTDCPEKKPNKKVDIDELKRVVIADIFEQEHWPEIFRGEEI